MPKRATTALLLTLLIATTLVLWFGAASATVELTLPIADPRSERYLSDFRGVEHSQTDIYRWSFQTAAIDLTGFARLPLLVDLRVTSPRPADEPTADLELARGTWVGPNVPVHGDWRHYQFLVPVNAYQPELSLQSSTFRPAERDKRSLGVALSRFQISIPTTLPPTVANLLILGPWRLLLLLALPLWVVLVAFRFIQRYQIVAAAVTGVVLLPIIYWLALNPLTFAYALAEELVPYLLLSVGISLLLLYHHALQPIRHNLQNLLDQDRSRLVIILSIALLLGGAMAIVTPAWEQPDEASHFEFAWLIANHSTWPTPGTSDPRIAAIGGGGRALYHQPLYHLLVSLPLRLATNLPILSQLMIARTVSVLLLLLTAAAAEQIARTLFPAGHRLRWLVPLAVVLNPTFTNLMSGVNNDVAVTTVCSWALVGIVRVLIYGLNWQRVLWLLASIPLAMVSKNTGAALLVCVPLALLVAFWMQCGWRWRYLMLGIAAIGVLLLFATITSGDPAHWYRWGSSEGREAQRTIRPEAPVGSHTLRLDTVAVPDFEGLSAPIPDGSRFSGKKITIGAWVWASKPIDGWAPGVVFQEREGELFGDHNEQKIDTTPHFFAKVYTFPSRLMFAHTMIWSVTPDQPGPAEIYVDGVVAVAGEYPIDQIPDFNTGTWGGKPFINLIQNGNAEDTWFYVRPTADRLIARYARRSPARIVASTADLGRVVNLELRDYIPWMAFTGFGGGYGGRIFLRDQIWQYILPTLIFLAVLGAAIGTRRLANIPSRRSITLATLAIGTIAIWFAILLAHTPPEFPGGIPSSRYGFTTIIPTMLFLVAGWLSLWPSRYRSLAASTLLIGFLLLDLAGLSTVQLFGNTICIRDPIRCVFTPVHSPFDLMREQ